MDGEIMNHNNTHNETNLSSLVGYSDQTEPPIPRESEQGKLNSFFV